jgi:hypothetical protein
MQLVQIVDCQIHLEVPPLKWTALQNRIALQQFVPHLVVLPHQLRLEQQVDQIAERVQSRASSEEDDTGCRHTVERESEASWVADNNFGFVDVRGEELRCELAVVVFLNKQRQNSRR